MTGISTVQYYCLEFNANVIRHYIPHEIDILNNRIWYSNLTGCG